MQVFTFIAFYLESETVLKFYNLEAINRVYLFSAATQEDRLVWLRMFLFNVYLLGSILC